jgi:hypothetical protein
VRYEPIRNLIDINALKQRRATEGPTLDFKSTVDGDAWWELGKDIAAFANHVGGTILVGAYEQSDGTAEYLGIARGLAAALASQSEQLAMFMEPRIRRVVTLLEQAIAESNAGARRRAWIWTRSASLTNNQFEIREPSVDVTSNSFICIESSTQLHIPFDDIEAVWRRENGWHVRVSGYIGGTDTRATTCLHRR